VDERERDAFLAEISELYGLVLRIASHIHTGDLPLTATQRLALIEIAAAGPMRLRTLARRMDTTPATATRAVDVLEEKGFVERSPDPEDKRGVQVKVTRKGRRWSRERGDAVRAVIERIPDDCVPSRLVGDLDRLNRALRQVTGVEETLAGQFIPPD
jgi:DNA-binding MarR family transcriptional regulator